MPVVTISSRGQIVIPSKMREELGLREGDALMMESVSGKLVAEKLKTPSRDELLMRWNKLVKEGNKRMRALGIKEEDVPDIIHRGRGIKP
jgi:antitoxin PrlF